MSRSSSAAWSPQCGFRLDRGRQYPGRGAAMGEAAHDRRAGPPRYGGDRFPHTPPPAPRVLNQGSRHATNQAPRFAADHVGSLLRPAALKEGARQARTRRESRPMSLPPSREPRDRGGDRQGRRRSGSNPSPTANSAAPPGQDRIFLIGPLDGVRGPITASARCCSRGPQPRPDPAAAQAQARRLFTAIRCWSISSFVAAHAKGHAER